MFVHKKNTLIAWLLRSKNLMRWPLMYSARPESVSAHSFEVAVIAHKLAVIAKVVFDKEVCPDRVCTLAVHHEAAEAAGVSDLPTPLKYANPELTKIIKEMESNIEDSLIMTEENAGIRELLKPIINQSFASDYERYLVKSADIISMHIKAFSEYNDGNREFFDVIKNLTVELETRRKESPEVEYFASRYLPKCLKTLDELIN